MITRSDNFCLSAAGLIEATTTAGAIRIANAVHYVINGRAFIKAAVDDLVMVAHTGTVFTALAAKQTCALFVMLNTAGTVTIIQSAIVANSTGTSYVPGAFEWPSDRDGFVCIGAVVPSTLNAATFTPGTTDLSASADVTEAYVNVALDYGRPISY